MNNFRLALLAVTCLINVHPMQAAERRIGIPETQRDNLEAARPTREAARPTREAAERDVATLTDVKVSLLRVAHSHLSLAECHELATVMVRDGIDDINQALKLVFQARSYTDAGELDHIVNAILEERKTFDQAEEIFAFRKFMRADQRLEEDDARKLSFWMSQGVDNEAAYKRLMREKFAFENDEVPDNCYEDICYNLYFSTDKPDMNTALMVANAVATILLEANLESNVTFAARAISESSIVEVANYVGAIVLDLGSKAFCVAREIRFLDTIDIALKAFANGRDLQKGLVQYLLENNDIEHIPAVAYYLLGEEFLRVLM